MFICRKYSGIGGCPIRVSPSRWFVRAAGEWYAGDARTVTIVGLKADGGGEESDCSSDDLSILLRLQGPEALAEVRRCAQLRKNVKRGGRFKDKALAWFISGTLWKHMNDFRAVGGSQCHYPRKRSRWVDVVCLSAVLSKKQLRGRSLSRSAKQYLHDATQQALHTAPISWLYRLFIFCLLLPLFLPLRLLLLLLLPFAVPREARCARGGQVRLDRRFSAFDRGTVHLRRHSHRLGGRPGSTSRDVRKA